MTDDDDDDDDDDEIDDDDQVMKCSELNLNFHDDYDD